MEQQLGWISIKFDYFQKSVEKIQVSLNSGKNNDSTLHEDQYTFLVTLAQFFCRMKNVSDKFVAKIKTLILYSIFFFFSEIVLFER